MPKLFDREHAGESAGLYRPRLKGSRNRGDERREHRRVARRGRGA